MIYWNFMKATIRSYLHLYIGRVVYVYTNLSSFYLSSWIAFAKSQNWAKKWYRDDNWLDWPYSSCTCDTDAPDLINTKDKTLFLYCVCVYVWIQLFRLSPFIRIHKVIHIRLSTESVPMQHIRIPSNWTNL